MRPTSGVEHIPEYWECTCRSHFMNYRLERQCYAHKNTPLKNAYNLLFGKRFFGSFSLSDQRRRVAQSQPMPRIVLVYFDAGGGHRAAASALAEAIREERLPWQVDLLKLQELLDSLDIVRRFTGIRIQDVYNKMLRNDWTLGSPQLMRVLQWTVRVFHRPTVRRLQRQWRETTPDLVASLVPHFNRALCRSLAKSRPGSPFVTILTDFADYPPQFWIERQSQFLICGSDHAVAQARDMGHPEEHIFRTSGMILNQRFYRYAAVDRRREREKLGLDPERLTGLVLFGGQGSRNKVLQSGQRAAGCCVRQRGTAGGRVARPQVPGAARRRGIHHQCPVLHAACRFLHR